MAAVVVDVLDAWVGVLERVWVDVAVDMAVQAHSSIYDQVFHIMA